MPIFLNLGHLSGENKEYLNTYKESCKTEIDTIAQLLIDVNPLSNPDWTARQERFKINIQNESRWNLEGVSGSGTRLSSFNSIKLERAVEFPNKLFAKSVFDEVDNGLVSAKKILDKVIKGERKNPSSADSQALITEYEAQREGITIARLYTQFLQVQAQSVVAEIGSIHYLDKLKTQLDKVYSANKNDPAYTQMLAKISDVQLLVKEYSLNTLQNEGIEKYSAANTMEIRSQVSTLCKEIKAGINQMDKNGVLQGVIPNLEPEKNAKYLKSVLEAGEDFFRIKNDINCENPTEISAITEARKKYTGYFEKVALVSGVMSIGSVTTAFALPVTAPLTGPAGLILGGVSSISGLSAFVLKTSNSIANLAQYGVLPSTDEVKGSLLGGVAVVIGGVAHIGPLLAATGKITNVTCTTLDAYDAVDELRNSSFKERQEELLKGRATERVSTTVEIDNPGPEDANSPGSLDDESPSPG